MVGRVEVESGADRVGHEVIDIVGGSVVGSRVTRPGRIDRENNRSVV